MYRRGTITADAFGSRDPMPPRIASLHVDSTIPSANEYPVTSPATVKSASNEPDNTVNTNYLTDTDFEPNTDVGHLRYTDVVTLPRISCNPTPSPSRPSTLSGAMSSSVSTPGCDSGTKWSDVAAPGVQALHQTSVPTGLEDPEHTFIIEHENRDDSLNSKLANQALKTYALTAPNFSSDVSTSVPTPGNDPNAKWSDAYPPSLYINSSAMSSSVSTPGCDADALRPCARKTAHSNKQTNNEIISRPILLSIMENPHILDTLMLNCPDYPTLFALVGSCKTAKSAFEYHPQGIIKAILKTMPQELQNLTVALIGINGSKIGTSFSIKKSLKTWLSKGSKPLRQKIQNNPIDTLRKLARSFAAIDLFLKVIPKNCESNFADYQKMLASRKGLEYLDVTDWSNKDPLLQLLLQQNEWSDVPDDTEWDVPVLPPSGLGPQAISLPLNDREMYRLKRALLRYGVFCALFYLGPDRHYDKRHNPRYYNPVPEFCKQRAFCQDQAIFLGKYVNPWEIGELAVVSHFMFDLVKPVPRIGSSSVPGWAANPCHITQISLLKGHADSEYLVRYAYFHKYEILRVIEFSDSYRGKGGVRHYGRNRHHDHEEVVHDFDNHVVWFASQGLTLLQRIYLDRDAGYDALVAKHGEPCYRAAELFLPGGMSADRRGYDVFDPKASWEPRQSWSDTLGMELPSKGWLGKSPASDSTGYDDAYWGEKWMRKIGYYMWDRD